MSEANVIFTLNGENLAVKCCTEDKMKDICNNYSAKINININSLLFFYGGNKINFDLSFKEQANFIDKNNHEMKILVNEKENNKFICPNRKKKINLNDEKLEEIIVSNDQIKDNIIGIKLQKDNIITSSPNFSNNQSKNINKKLNMISKDIEKNNEKLNNLSDNYININNINNKITISNTIKINPNSEIVDYLNNKNLLENIKSKYISKFLFSHLDEKIKLKIIKYNKKFQNKINIQLVNYKFYSGKYIIYKANNKGKEYDGFYDNVVIYKGEYLCGKRHGKGKEYYNNDGKLLFEGEYLNGKRNGKGKEYYNNGKLLFEGEFINGERLNGKLYDNKGNLYSDLESTKGLIKEYYDEEQILFEGEYLNGKRNGKGKEYCYLGYLIFEGEYLNGKRNGKGAEYSGHGNKLLFEGEYLNGKRNGKGTEYYWNLQIKFNGIYYNGKKWNGIGYDQIGRKIYELKNGKGYIKEIGHFCLLIFEGEYLNGEINGKVKEYYNDGKLKFDGKYLYSYKLSGKFYIDGKLEYEGEYLYNQKWNGKGYDENGNIVYELKNGNGKVKEYYDNGKLYFEGKYLNGKRNGKGKKYSGYDGTLLYKGYYLNGKETKNLRILKNKN